MPSTKQIIASLALAGAAAVSADSFNGVERELIKIEATNFIVEEPVDGVIAASFPATDKSGDDVVPSAEGSQGHISYFE